MRPTIKYAVFLALVAITCFLALTALRQWEQIDTVAPHAKMFLAWMQLTGVTLGMLPFWWLMYFTLTSGPTLDEQQAELDAAHIHHIG